MVIIHEITHYHTGISGMCSVGGEEEDNMEDTEVMEVMEEERLLG